MSINPPPELDWVFVLIAGSNFPKGDEDSIRQIASALDVAAAEFSVAGDGLAHALNDVVNGVGGSVGRAFGKYGEQLVEQQTYYGQSAADLAVMAREFALRLESAKYQILVQIAFAAAVPLPTAAELTSVHAEDVFAELRNVIPDPHADVEQVVQVLVFSGGFRPLDNVKSDRETLASFGLTTAEFDRAWRTSRKAGLVEAFTDGLRLTVLGRRLLPSDVSNRLIGHAGEG